MARGKKGAVGGLTPARAKNLVAVAKVVGPAVLPVVTPYVLRAASAAGDAVDRYRARKLGVEVADLAEFSGRGGALHARLAGADNSLVELAERPDVAEADRQWAERSRDTLSKLAAAVRAAERMPSARRRAAHRAVGAELDPIEAELLHRLGV
jgi:Family of unknown function (DUF6474)